ncbi:MAG: anaerobic glycerol-3-phosphate dehydrogenase subunit A [Deltaproteobacteria bacterium]|nr:anaerobic glycerol-3-phosphate dehydrogenase subunit A [Deltaproteobacteria bacterium]
MEFDVIIIGGGATGAGVLRDCVLRGLKALLIEKDDLAAGTSGRNHGLLHSGARYAVKDQESAVECWAENQVLRRIANHCIEDTGGLFVTLPEDDPAYHDRLLVGCRAAGMPVEEISPDQARQWEPNLNPAIKTALKVPDATVDPFRLTAANVLDAIEHGGQVLTHTMVLSLIRKQDRILGVTCQKTGTSRTFDIYGRVIVNATGIWGQRLCRTADVDLIMFPSKGSMVIIDYRINGRVVNRCRPPGDGDIIVPGDTVSLIGTSSREIPYEDIDNLRVDDDEIEVLLAEGEKMIPNVSRTRVLRAYAGVRPLLAQAETKDQTPRGREISRGIVLIDHQLRDGLSGLATIVGGKLMTYRLMAEKTVDLVAAKLGLSTACQTHQRPLPGSEKIKPKQKKGRQFSGAPESVVGSTQYRHGERVHRILGRITDDYGLICECEMVTAGEVKYALNRLAVTNLLDLRRRTRIGMGPCQGQICAFRAAGLFVDLGVVPGEEANRLLVDFLEERFKGIRPILWGDALREIEFTYWIYQGLFGWGSGIPMDQDIT